MYSALQRTGELNQFLQLAATLTVSLFVTWSDVPCLPLISNIFPCAALRMWKFKISAVLSKKKNIGF